MIIESVKAIIIKNKKYLLQLRDNKKNIFFPNYWGLFGGRIDSGEMYIDAIKREIREELNLNVRIEKNILNTDYSVIGLTKKRKLVYYECFVKDFTNLKLTEGQKYKFFNFTELKNFNIIPMDYVAISSHYNYKYKRKKMNR